MMGLDLAHKLQTVLSILEGEPFNRLDLLPSMIYTVRLYLVRHDFFSFLTCCIFAPFHESGSVAQNGLLE